MVNAYIRLFNFAVLQRYRWRAKDFADFQDGGYVAMIEGIFQGTFQGAILQGLNIVSTTGLNFTVASGFAVGPTGDLFYMPTPTTGSFPSPTAGAWGARSLCVIQPNPVTPASGIITPPTMPLTTAPLFVDHYAQIVTYDGQTLSGGFPATGPNDVILFGVRLTQGATSFQPSGATRIDEDVPGRRGSNSGSRIQSNITTFDNRCRPYRQTANIMGVKPAQTARGYLTYTGYPGIPTASIFPKTAGGAYNGDSGDATMNFTTGAIDGSDGFSPAFTPTIPAANQFIWALVGLSSTDQLTVQYGTQGTYLQCLLGIKNQTLAGAGSVPSSTGFKVAFVLLGSNNGTAITEMDVYDARGMINQQPASTAQVVRRITGPITTPLLTTDQVVELDCTAGAINITMLDRATNLGKSFRFQRVDNSANVATLNRAGADTFLAAATTYLLDTPFQQQVITAGTTTWYGDD